MAIATFERDPARDTGSPDLRFRLLQEICRTADAGFWRAVDRRSGKTCVVRVIDADREQSSRRLGDLHRERTLAERIGHPAVLRADVPTIEDDRIFQLVDPEPARGVDGDAEGGRLAVLNLLIVAAAVLADAHARGVFHGAFSRASCLLTSDGRLLVHGFTGDAASAAAIRDGAAADHRAFLEFAAEMLRSSGGAPPRLRRYFAQHLIDGAPKPTSAAMAELCADLRESLEDTFPWPIPAAAVAVADAAVDGARAGAAGKPAPAQAPPANGVPARVGLPTEQAATPESPTLTQPGLLGPPVDIAAAAPAAPPMHGAAGRRSARRAATGRASVPTIAPTTARVTEPAPAPPSVAVAAPVLAIVPPPSRAAEPASNPAPTSSVAAPIAAPAAESRRPSPAVNPKPARTHEPDPASEASRPPPDLLAARSLRPWLAAAIAIVIAAAALHDGSKGGSPPGSPVTAPTAAPVAPSRPESASPAPAPVVPATDAPRQPAVASRRPEAPAPRRQEAVSPATRAVQRTVAAPPPQGTPRNDTASAGQPVDPAAPSPQAVRSRIATLVAGGNRALTALEPGAATEAFTAALAMSPDDRAAIDGIQRARRLQGVEALMRDAREASARGDHARAVQGYAQALSNDPRNRGLADALSLARRNLGRDATSSLLAEGHTALGAGRFEEARAAFEKALQSSPSAPGARRAAEQASTAILLRDAAEARRADLAQNGG